MTESERLRAENRRLRGALEGLERVVSRFPLQERSWPLIVVEWAKDLERIELGVGKPLRRSAPDDP